MTFKEIKAPTGEGWRVLIGVTIGISLGVFLATFLRNTGELKVDLCFKQTCLAFNLAALS